MNRVRQRLLGSADYQLVELPQERGQSFSRSRRSEYQGMRTTCNRRPSLTLRVARIPEGLLEPLPHQRVESRQRRGAACHIDARLMPGRRVLKHTTQLLRSPLENLSGKRTLPELIELDLFRPLEVVHED